MSAGHRPFCRLPPMQLESGESGALFVFGGVEGGLGAGRGEGWGEERCLTGSAAGVCHTERRSDPPTPTPTTPIPTHEHAPPHTTRQVLLVASGGTLTGIIPVMALVYFLFVESWMARPPPWWGGGAAAWGGGRGGRGRAKRGRGGEALRACLALVRALAAPPSLCPARCHAAARPR